MMLGLLIWMADITEVWVPKIFAGTVEGDRIALEKIVEYIRT